MRGSFMGENGEISWLAALVVAALLVCVAA